MSTCMEKKDIWPLGLGKAGSEGSAAIPQRIRSLGQTEIIAYGTYVGQVDLINGSEHLSNLIFDFDPC